jgi:hypothetical protein
MSRIFLPRTALLASDCLIHNVNAPEQVECGAFSVFERCQFTGATSGALGNWESPVTVRNCLFTTLTDGFYFPYVYLNHYSGAFENNLFTGLKMAAQPVVIRANCFQATTFTDNVFYDCHRITQEGSPCPLLDISCDSTATQPYVVARNVMYACTTSGYAKGIWARHRGFLQENRLHDLVMAFPEIWAPSPAVRVDSADSMIMQSNLFDRNGLALIVNPNSYADARWNWWGDSSGPYHATQNPAGQGDTIVGNVAFIPWYPDTSFLAVPGLGKPLPKEFQFDAYPNPFNSTVRLRLIPNEIQIVKVELFDLLGRKVKEIWSGPLAFQKDISFDASSLASGVYFARVTNTIFNRPLATTKLVLLR